MPESEVPVCRQADNASKHAVYRRPENASRLPLVPGQAGDSDQERYMAEQLQQAFAILRRKQVEARTGLRRSTIYAKVAAGEFPAPVRLGARAVGWLEAEIQQWLASRVAESRAKSEGAA